MAIPKQICIVRAGARILAALALWFAIAGHDAYAQGGPPGVTSIAPTSGSTAGGTAVTVTGFNFTGATAVQFGGTNATTFTVISSTSISATSPAGAAGTVDVTVTTPSGTSPTSAADQFTYTVPAPTVTSVTPNNGPAAGGTPVTIAGTNFTGATAVQFGGTNATTFTVISSTSITATSPAGAAGTVDVRVTTPSGTSAVNAADQFTYTAVASTTTLSSSQNPSSFGQPVTFSARVTGLAPTGTVLFFDGASQIGTGTLVAGTATFTTSSLAVGSHLMSAKYSGDANNAASTAGLTQIVGIPADSIKLRQLQVVVTPVIAQLSGQAIVGAIDNAIEAGFSDNPQTLSPNGRGFTFNIALDQPAPNAIGNVGGGNVRPGNVRSGNDNRNTVGPGSLASGRQGGNGAPPGTRLIDMTAIPLPPGSGMPPIGETRFSPTEVVVQFGPAVTQQQIDGIAQRFGLAVVTQQPVGVLGRAVFTFRITNGRSVREIIRQFEAARFNAAIQPQYNYGLTQNQTAPAADLGDPAQYILKKLRIADAHRITKADNIIVAVIDSAIDNNQPDLAGTVTDRFDAGCGASAPDVHGTGMAGAIASHGRLLGVAPRSKIIAVCAFGGPGHPEATSIKIIRGLDYAIQRGAKIVNMSFAGPRDPTLSQALQIAREKGILLIAAAGNNGPKSSPLYPGADPSVMAVTATDEDDRLFNGANQGKYVTVAAPGVNILVPAPDGGVQLTTGTSVATASVSGVAALLLAHKPSLKPEEIRYILVTTAQHLGPKGMNSQFGAGLVDPIKALELAMSEKRASVGNSVNSIFASSMPGEKTGGGESYALAYAGNERMVTKSAPPAAPPRLWLGWIDVRAADFSSNTFGNDLKGTQVNALAGLTRKITPDLLVGVLGGYEHFHYTSQAYNGVLKGYGWTTGAYLGWRFTQDLRFDASAARSEILVNEVAGTAAGDFTGQRWLASVGMTGTYRWQPFVVEPSARVYALWERENGYTDSLGTVQSARNFETGRASSGVKISYPFALLNSVNLTPYAGLYGDYYFARDDAFFAGVIPAPLLEGWSARAVGGVSATFSGGAQVAAGGEFGGIGGKSHIVTWRVRSRVPF